MNVPLNYLLALSAVLFTTGLAGVILRRNILIIFMSIELMLNATNLQLIAFGRYFGNVNGQIFVFFVLVVAAAEAAIGLAIIVSLVRNYKDSLNGDDFSLLKG
ncbi:MAG TPA: NADH-quinone oxidoreductase subunit NuoK [Chloroflexota bacterium]|nr:NADH-quinone oxidoreductase subunit NuoK [Chloroflexota bacterium]